MDFDNGGIEGDSRNKNGTDTLEQKNEPIISFSPQRCRFDSVQSNSRKSSSSFPISVDDLQLNDPLVSSSSSTSGQQSSSVNNVTSNTSTTNLINTSASNNASSKSTSLSQLVGKQHQQPPFPNVHNHLSSQTQKNQAPQHQPYSFVHNHQSALNSSSSSSATAASALIGPARPPAVINTFSSSSSSTLNSTSSAAHSFASTSKSLGNRAPLIAPANNCLASSSADKNSISLMVNGAVLSTNNNSSTTSTAHDLQKRLERRIAQASAVASASSSSTKTKASDSILSDIIATGSSNAGVVNNNAIIDPIGATNGNQISFSPQNSSSSKQQKMLGSLPSSLWEPDPSDAELEDLLWESKKAPSITNAVDSSSKAEMKSLLDNSPNSLSRHVDDGENTNVTRNENDENRTSELERQKSKEIAHDTALTSPSKQANPSINSSNNNNNANKCNTSNNKNNASKSSQSNTRTGSSGSGGGGGSSSNTTHASQAGYTSASTATPSSSSSTSVIVVNSGFDIRKVSALLPPQRLAIPSKQSNSQLQSSRSMATSNGKLTDDNDAATFSTSSYKPGGHKTSSRNTSVSETSCIDGNASGSNSVLKGNGNAKGGSHSSKLSSEKKPLVQWDSDESEEELSFFPPSKRGVITDNLSIDNMSLSGEEEDLHLTPPRPLARKCPCDPRSWLERSDLTHGSHHHGDTTRSVNSRPCVIS